MADKGTDTPVRTFSDPVAQCIWNYKEEAEWARRNRYLQNRENFETYHLRQDYSHKKRGQSKEFLAKQPIAIEQLSSFLQQGLMDIGDWFRIDLQDGVDPAKVRVPPKAIEKILLRQLAKNKFPNFFNDTLKLGLLGSLMIVKVGGKWVTESKFEARPEESDLGQVKKSLHRKDKRTWQLMLSLVRQEDYFPDPTINPDGTRLFEVQRIEMDWHELRDLALANPDDFDMDAINNTTFSVDELQKQKISRETGQNVSYSQYRKRVTLYEAWGTFLEANTGEVILKNGVAAINQQGLVVRKLRKNPLWHGGSPFVTSPIIRVPLSVWHKALMDAPTRHNIAMNELYNLLVDAAMMEVHGIKQIHSAWLENSNDVADGIAPGQTLMVNSSCPPGAKVLERVDTSALSQQAVGMYHLMDNEFLQSSLSNDTRLGGLPQRAVKATEVVASNQSLTGIMNGIVKVIEEEMVSPLLEKAWLTMAQHMNDLDSDEVGALVGKDLARVLATISPEELFAETARGQDYKVFGLSMTLNKVQDFRKIQSLLQSIGASPMMMQEFMRKYSMTSLLGEIIKSLDIDEDKIKATPQELAQRQAEQAAAAAQQQAQNTQGGEGTNPQSQIPQASASSAATNPMVGVRGMNNIGMTNPAGGS